MAYNANQEDLLTPTISSPLVFSPLLLTDSDNRPLSPNVRKKKKGKERTIEIIGC